MNCTHDSLSVALRDLNSAYFEGNLETASDHIIRIFGCKCVHPCSNPETCSQMAVVQTHSIYSKSHPLPLISEEKKMVHLVPAEVKKLPIGDAC